MPTTDTIEGFRLRRAQQSLTNAEVLDGSIAAGLILLAAHDDFGAWLAKRRGALSDDFEIGL